MSSERRTPPLGSPALMFDYLRQDFKDFRETDQKEHAALRDELGEVKSLNMQQNMSLVRIESKLSTERRAATETGKTKRQTIKTIGAIIMAFITGILAHYLGG